MEKLATDDSSMLCAAKRLAPRQCSSKLISAWIACLGLRFCLSASAIEQHTTVRISKGILFVI